MSQEFRRNKKGEGCLSQWQISQWGLQQLSATAAAACAAHVDTCADCAARWQIEQEAVAAARTAVVPDALLEAHRQRPAPRRWIWHVPMALATCALAAYVMVLVRPDTGSDVLVKGEPGLLVAVLHAGRVEEMALEHVGRLAPGDELRLRAPSTTPTWQRLQVLRAEGWGELFAGDVAANSYVPLGLKVNAQAPSQLRLVVCPADPHWTGSEVPAGCHVYGAQF